MLRRIEPALLLAAFFLSGLAALVYQTAWLRQFSLVFGTSELAVAAVLAAYMGGLALGAGIAARFANRIRRPVLVYCLLEAGIALSALTVPALLLLADWLYAGALGGNTELPDAWTLGQPVFYLAVAFVVLATPTALMGATLPCLTRHFVRRNADVGPRVAVLYAINTAGAVAGTLLAAFVLLPGFGLNATVISGAAVNGMVFLLILPLARTVRSAGAPSAAIATGAPVAVGAARESILLPLMLLSGAVTFLYEVLWTRMLTHVLGGSVYAFATMLAAFLAGIAAGGAVGGILARNRQRARLAFVLVEIAIAGLAASVYAGMQAMLPGVDNSLSPIAYAFAVMLPATFFIGCTFPIAVRIITPDERSAATASARTYGWNTAGAIFGAVIAGFWLIPTLGFSGAIRLGVVVNLLIAVVAVFTLVQPLQRMAAGFAVALLVAAIAFYSPERPSSLVALTAFETAAATQAREVYFAVGRSATVRLTQDLGIYELTTNGLPEAAILPLGASPAGQTQQWLTALPLIARPQARSMLLVGFGGGVAVENVPASLADIDVIELESEVIAANRQISHSRLADPLQDERIRIVLNDARNALRLSDKRYDIIVSQPSHPWTAGASHLFTLEFAELARSHLEPDGVFLQWMSAEFIDEPLLRSLVATLVDVFANVRLYQPAPGVLLFLASDSALALEAELLRTGLPLRSDPLYFGYMRINGVEDLLAALMLDETGTRTIATDAPAVTDDRNLMAMASRSRADGLTAAQLSALLAGDDPLTDADSRMLRDARSIDAAYIAARLITDGQTDRAARLAMLLPDRSTAALIRGLLAGSAGDAEAAREFFLGALDADSRNESARFALLEPELPRLARNAASAETQQLLTDLTGTATSVVRGWRLAAESDWRALAALDSTLAQVRPTDLWYPHAIQLRADWRTKVVGDVVPVRDAIRLIDRAVAVRPGLDLFVLRAAAADVLRDVDSFRESSRYATEIVSAQLGDIESGRQPGSTVELETMFRRISALRVRLVRLSAADEDITNLDRETAELADRMGEQLRRIQVLQR